MRDIIAKEAAAIEAIEVNDEFEKADILMNCPGKIVATGMGKVGYIAHKFAATLSSTGTPAFSSIQRRQVTAIWVCFLMETASLPSRPVANL